MQQLTTSKKLQEALSPQGVEYTKQGIDKIIAHMQTLSSSMAHELQTPLTAINLYAELLENSSKQLSANNHKCKVDIAKYAAAIKKITTNASYLVSNLLLQIKNSAREDANVNKHDFQCCSITKDIEETLLNYPFLTAEERHLITFNKACDFKYIGSSVLTSHILFNLIKNALRAIKSTNKNKCKIIISLKNTGLFNNLIFTDTASGIPQSFLPKLFDLFASTDKANGNGVGLAFCKTIMQIYGGDITCTSIENERTEFVLSFPCIPQQEQSKQAHTTKIS